ncbi:hypothetical protein Q8A67_013289 [Cirrhinus molitorella]|uniref:Uncharacterized protein n=1 Tax=Cirrhinus molitorella TaxID=172907 RepID=A0AA88PMX2_9TELE|nr:hypothetical protein Q8A67_013289 [Cirrhinus molitorella]
MYLAVTLQLKTSQQQRSLELNKGKPVMEGIQRGTTTYSGPSRETGLFIQVSGNTLTLVEAPDYDLLAESFGEHGGLCELH